MDNYGIYLLCVYCATRAHVSRNTTGTPGYSRLKTQAYTVAANGPTAFNMSSTSHPSLIK